MSGSEGRVVYKEFINFSNLLFFLSYFLFFMFNEIGDVMVFVMVLISLDFGLFGNKNNNSFFVLGFLFEYVKNEIVVVFEFDIFNRGNCVRILLGKFEFFEVRNFFFEGDLMMENGGLMLSCMIDYEVSLKRMMVWFRKLGMRKMLDLFFDFFVDLGEILNGGEFMVGLSFINGNFFEVYVFYLWSFDIRYLMLVCVFFLMWMYF